MKIVKLAMVIKYQITNFKNNTPGQLM